MAGRDDEIVQLLTEIRDLIAAGAPPSSAPRGGVQKPQRPHKGGGAQAGTSAHQVLLEARSDAEDWNVVWEHGATLDRWLAVLAIAEEEVGEGTALTAPEIAKVLDERFRLAGVYATNINRDLKKARTLVARRARGKGFEYRLTREGLRTIRNRRDELSARVR